jgi:cephalosporin-C deacetylase-like acetyl esterase
MKIIPFMGITMFGLAIAAQAGVDLSKTLLRGSTDLDPLTYRVGQEMIFTIAVDYQGQTPDTAYYLSWFRTGDDGKTGQGLAPIAPDRPVTVKTAMAKSGFVRVRAVLSREDGTPLRFKNERNQTLEVVFDGGAGAAAETLKGSDEPADFDEFWAKQKKKLAAVPLKFHLEKHPNSTAHHYIYKVRVDCAGPRPVTGYLVVPAGAAPKSLAAIAYYQGYGVSAPKAPHGAENRLVFHVNAHGVELEKDQAYYADFENQIKSNGQSYAFDPTQNREPENSYFNGMALRVMRSLEFLRALPEWNGKELVAYGGSQGGLQSVWGAALDHSVTKCVSNITWCCDLSGHEKSGRLNGWRPKYTPGLDYYDAINHAKRVQCPVEVRAGLGDYVCPPSGLAILYNQLSAPKKIIWSQGATHGYTPPSVQSFVQENPLPQ